MLKLGIISLGCSKNRVDTEAMLGALKRKGIDFTKNPYEADVILINTCGFINEAKQESINTILEMAEYKKTGKLKYLMVAGCLSQRYGNELVDELPEVDVFLGAFNQGDVADALSYAIAGRRFISFTKGANPLDYRRRILTTPKYSAYLKVAEGCSNNCSYCAIPQIRGKLVSRPLASVVDEAKYLADNGVLELTIIAQDTTKYGWDLADKKALITLLNRLKNIRELKWIRLLYCYPENITQELLDTMMSDERICKYIDMPIQHINDDILKLMNRQSSKKKIYSTVEMIRKTFADFALRTSVITGFPTETRDQHKDLVDAITDLCFDNLGVFAYSAEEGTKAATLTQVSDEIKKARYHEIMSLQADISYNQNSKRVSKEYDILIEGFDKKINRFYGRGYFQSPETDGLIYIRNGENLQAGEFVKATMEKAYDYDLLGNI